MIGDSNCVADRNICFGIKRDINKNSSISETSAK